MQYIIDIALFLSIIIVGFILHDQIKSQASVINSLKTYFEIFDIEKVKAFDKLRHESTMMYVKTYLNTEIKKKITPELKVAAEILRKDMEARFDEISNVLLDIILTVEESDRKQFIIDNLPLNKKEFLNVLEEIENESNFSSSDNDES